ncbi:hypothetical protein ACFQ9Z_16760 [Streptomyces sp. NPDC056580]|uniref:hypothetical protein n=1 Tax=Streptomyces sp. NPDC056580 TaxID=3345872 RepID=UPI0036BC1684
MTSENVAEQETVESAAAVSAKAVDDQLIDELVLQHQRNGKWTTLKTTAAVNKNGTYTIKRTFTTKGTEQVRVATKSGTFRSSLVTVQVS